MAIINVRYEYSGLSDYWGGEGRRWDNDAGCLFAYYGIGTTLRDCVDEWVEDFGMGGDCDSFPEDITSEDIRAAILDFLTEQGRADYESGAIAECAVEYATANNFNECTGCGESVGEEHGTEHCGTEGEVLAEDCYDEDADCCESPIWVILVEVEVCEDCGDAVEMDGDNLCPACGAWDLVNYDENEALGDKSGKWAWVNGDEELGPYDSEEEAQENNPTIV